MFSDGACTRRTNSTIFFAYSNEMDSGDFSGILSYFLYYIQFPSGYTAFANVRFDVRTEEPIQYHSDNSSFNQSILDRLPDPSLGYTDNRGSDVFNVLQRFLDNNQVTLCGSFVYVLVCRYPDEAEVSQIISRLRDNHVFVHFIAKATHSAGTNNKALCDVAAATNGFCIFADGYDFLNAADHVSELLFWPYQYISQNNEVSGAGTIEMPILPPPTSRPMSVFVIITLQDHALDNNVSLNYTIAAVNGEFVFNGPDRHYGKYGTGILDFWNWTYDVDFKWTIDYSYPDNKPQRIEVRMYSLFYQDFVPLPPI